MNAIQKLWQNVNPGQTLLKPFAPQALENLLASPLGPPVRPVVVRLGECTAHPQVTTQSLPPGTHKLVPLVGGDHRGDPKVPPLVLNHGQGHFGAGQPNLPFGESHYPPGMPIYTDNKGVPKHFVPYHGGSENKSIQTELIIAGGIGVDSMGDFKLRGLLQACQDSHTPLNSLAIFLCPCCSTNDT